MIILISGLIIVLAFIIIAACLTIILGFGMIFVNLKTRVPWVKVPMANLEPILQEINLPRGAKISDLGCGDGRWLFALEAFTATSGRCYNLSGYELSAYPFLKSQLLKISRKSKVKFYRRDFFKRDNFPEQGILIFLVKKIMPKVSALLQKKLKPGTLVISYAFELPGWPVHKVLETRPSPTYIYYKN